MGTYTSCGVVLWFRSSWTTVLQLPSLAVLKPFGLLAMPASSMLRVITWEFTASIWANSWVMFKLWYCWVLKLVDDAELVESSLVAWILNWSKLMLAGLMSGSDPDHCVAVCWTCSTLLSSFPCWLESWPARNQLCEVLNIKRMFFYLTSWIISTLIRWSCIPITMLIQMDITCSRGGRNRILGRSRKFWLNVDRLNPRSCSGYLEWTHSLLMHIRCSRR